MSVDCFPGKSATIQLRDGRSLGIIEYGRRGLDALFYFHGFPGSRLEARALSEPAEEMGVRLIGVDRPGMGRSTFKAGRQILDWPDDVAELADQLRIGRFCVVGCSGGGPYALACAKRFPDRVVSCAVVSSIGVICPPLSMLSRGIPRVLLPLLRAFFKHETQAAKSLRLFDWWWPEPDKKALGLGVVRETIAASLAEAFRQGSRGPAYDARLLGSDWGFKAEEINHPTLHLWHGELDRQVPISMGRHLAERLHGCRVTFCPDEGHISLIVNRRREIVEASLSRA